jgi:hypothetical protein
MIIRDSDDNLLPVDYKRDTTDEEEGSVGTDSALVALLLITKGIAATARR